MLETVMDIFRNDGFSVASLRRVEPDIPYVPQALGNMGLFGDKPISTRGIEVYQDAVTRELIPTTEIGAPPVRTKRVTSTMRYLSTVRLAKSRRINSHELQDVAAAVQAGNWNGALATAVQEITNTISKLKSELEMTKEFHRLGALLGILYDADGTTVLRNYFTDFGVSPAAEVSINFSTTAEEDLLPLMEDTFYRPIMRALKDRKTPTTYVAALVGDTYWSRMMKHKAVRETYRYQQGAHLLEGRAWRTFDFASITWINYMGTDDGTTIAIPATKAKFFPVNVSDMFEVYLSPGEGMDDVNTKGRPVYTVVQPDPETQKNRWVDVEIDCYPLYANLFPQATMSSVSTG